MAIKFSNENLKISIIAGLMILFGILFIALPQSSFNVIVTILGWILVVVGVAFVVNYFVCLKKMTTSVQFVAGVLLCFFGILFLTIPNIYIALIGLAFAFFGVQYSGDAILRQKTGDKGWWKDFLFGIVQFVLGATLVVLNYTSALVNVIMIVLGISLILSGGLILFTVFVLKRKLKKVGGMSVEINPGKEIKKKQTVKTTTATKVDEKKNDKEKSGAENKDETVIATATKVEETKLHENKIDENKTEEK